jgi:hypothetical protein
MMEGALFCEECGLSLWGDSQGEVSTRKLEEESNEFSVKSGWGTATFQDFNQVIIHIRESAEPVTIRPSTEYLIGRQDSASGITPDLDLTTYGALEKGVSRLHAALRRGEDVLSIVDLDSANGTFLNGITRQRVIKLLREAGVVVVETTLSYFSQMTGITVQSFLSAASGIAVAIALIRGFARRHAIGVAGAHAKDDLV